MSEEITIVNDNSFAAEVLQADLPVLVDFWAEWCGPCKMLIPTLEEIAKDFAGKIKVAKLNVDENPQTSTSYNIRGIPTLIIFKNGKVTSTKVGAATKAQLTDFINAIL